MYLRKVIEDSVCFTSLPIMSNSGVAALRTYMYKKCLEYLVSKYNMRHIWFTLHDMMTVECVFYLNMPQWLSVQFYYQIALSMCIPVY